MSDQQRVQQANGASDKEKISALERDIETCLKKETFEDAQRALKLFEKLVKSKATK